MPHYPTARRIFYFFQIEPTEKMKDEYRFVLERPVPHFGFLSALTRKTALTNRHLNYLTLGAGRAFSYENCTRTMRRSGHDQTIPSGTGVTRELELKEAESEKMGCWGSRWRHKVRRRRMNFRSHLTIEAFMNLHKFPCIPSCVLPILVHARALISDQHLHSRISRMTAAANMKHHSKADSSQMTSTNGGGDSKFTMMCAATIARPNPPNPPLICTRFVIKPV